MENEQNDLDEYGRKDLSGYEPGSSAKSEQNDSAESEPKDSTGSGAGAALPETGRDGLSARDEPEGSDSGGGAEKTAEAGSGTAVREYENAAALTGMRNASAAVNRAFAMKILSVSAAGILLLCFIFTTFNGGKKKKQQGLEGPESARTAEFLAGQRDAAMRELARNASLSPAIAPEESGEPEIVAINEGGAYRGGAWGGGYTPPRSEERQAPPPPPAPPPGSGSGGGPPRADPAHSSLVPQVIEGSLFGGGRAAAAAPQRSAGAYEPAYSPAASALPGAITSGQDYLQQLRDRLQAAAGGGAAPPAGDPFYQGAPQGAGAGSGNYIRDGSLWRGTIIPGTLITAINTDLPGEVIARVTANVYDSKTGKLLLIPQGTLVVANYNSSVSYAASRVQIVWNTLIRPDGYELDLGGMNGVDGEGMAGQEAQYHENYFEYVKAAGIISLFTLAESRITEDAAKYSDASAGAIAQANSEVVNKLGGSILGRALEIKPTLTVENGARVNIMVNRTLSLPPLPDYPASGKYKR